MPAKDKYHDSVKRALQKDGWEILDEDFQIILSNRNLWIDIHAAQDNDNAATAILIEVKTFENMPSPMNYLHAVVGQYTVYRLVLAHG